MHIHIVVKLYKNRVILYVSETYFAGKSWVYCAEVHYKWGYCEICGIN